MDDERWREEDEVEEQQQQRCLLLPGKRSMDGASERAWCTAVVCISLLAYTTLRKRGRECIYSSLAGYTLVRY